MEGGKRETSNAPAPYPTTYTSRGQGILLWPLVFLAATSDLLWHWLDLSAEFERGRRIKQHRNMSRRYDTPDHPGGWTRKCSSLRREKAISTGESIISRFAVTLVHHNASPLLSIRHPGQRPLWICVCSTTIRSCNRQFPSRVGWPWRHAPEKASSLPGACCTDLPEENERVGSKGLCLFSRITDDLRSPVQEKSPLVNLR